MIFWGILFGGSTLLCLVNMLIPSKYRSILISIYVFLLWLIASFRYMIGTDYFMYMDYYIRDVFISVWDHGEGMVEIANLLITIVLKDLHLGSQMYFLIYETVILFFFYKGAKFYSTNSYMLMLSMLLYVVICMPGTYFWSMNGIRQAAAISICFWGSHFWYTRKYIKMIFSFLFAFTFHMTTPIMVIIFLVTVCILQHFKLSFNRICLAILLLYFCTLSGLSARFLFFALENLPEYGDKYGAYLTMVGQNVTPTFGLLTIICVLFLLISRDYFREIRRKEGCFLRKEIYYLSTTFLFIRILTSFKMNVQNAEVISMLESMIHRVDAYFVPFFIIAIASWLTWLYSMHDKLKLKPLIVTMLIISIFSMHSIRQIIITDDSITNSMNPSAGNIHYEMRFDLFNE